ncbi:MAG: pro-sigmaK processing inhibitor BofA family protein [Nanoarchaeota archaeon]
MLVNVLGIILMVLIVVVLFFIVKKIILLALNSVIGIFALIGWNVLFDSTVHIGFWSVIITAIGGIFGFAFVLAMHYLKLGF